MEITTRKFFLPKHHALVKPDKWRGDANGIKTDDFHTGGAAESVLRGLEGSDELYGAEGNDSLYGGAGKDSLYGGLGNDVLMGGPGADLINGDVGNDVLIGAGGRDSLYGGDGNDLLNGLDGADFMEGGNGADIYYIDDVNDIARDSGTDFSNDILFIGSYLGESYSLEEGIEYATLGTLANKMSLVGNVNKNILTGNDYDNRLDGSGGNDILNGGFGNDSLIGGSGNDTLYGGAGVDYLSGGSGDDFYMVDSSEEIISEGINDGFLDVVQSSFTYTLSENFEKLILSGGSVISGTGNASANQLIGNLSANQLNGKEGNDSITAGSGNDTLIGGLGQDTLIGGLGNDLFKFEALSESGILSINSDVIDDFVRNQDKIDLSLLDADSAQSGDQAFTAVISSSASFTKAGQLQLKQGVLYANTDSDNTAEFSITLTGMSTLTMSDIIA